MSTSLRKHEGYLLIDHRNSPGISEDLIRAISPDLPTNMGRGMIEVPTYTCNHCKGVVVMNALRTRDRGFCPKCNHYVCDVCNGVRIKTGECKTFDQIATEIQEAAARSQSIKEI